MRISRREAAIAGLGAAVVLGTLGIYLQLQGDASDPSAMVVADGTSVSSDGRGSDSQVKADQSVAVSPVDSQDVEPDVEPDGAVPDGAAPDDIGGQEDAGQVNAEPEVGTSVGSNSTVAVNPTSTSLTASPSGPPGAADDGGVSTSGSAGCTSTEPGDCKVVTFLRSQPEDGATGVDPQAGFRFQFEGALADSRGMRAEVAFLPSEGRTPPDPGSKEPIVVTTEAMSIDLTRQNLSLALPVSLRSFGDYRLSLTGLRSASGSVIAPIEIEFRTGPLIGGSDRFDVAKLSDLTGPTGAAFGPDGHAYVTTVGGEIIRFDIGGDGRPTGERVTLVSNPDFQFIALAFEPGSERYVWVSQWAKQPSDEFSSEIARYDLSVGTASEQKKVVGLPRHPRGNHSVQGLDFGGRKLYATVGSVTAGGAWSDAFFGPPVLEENSISASIIEVDYRAISGPINTSKIGISAVSSPVRLFATGLRNAYDLLWHSNGNLYSNINQNSGSTDEASPPPTDGPCAGLPEFVGSNLVSDTLNLIRRGGYYGHPNPSRGECIVMGGGQGPFAVQGYASDQAADPNFDEGLIAYYASDRGGSFGISVNGMDEYLGSGPLNGAILSADFSGSRSILIARLGRPSSRLVLDGAIDRLSITDGEAITFNHPIDVASSPTGSVLVADFGEWLGGRYGDGGAVYFMVPIAG